MATERNRERSNRRVGESHFDVPQDSIAVPTSTETEKRIAVFRKRNSFFVPESRHVPGWDWGIEIQWEHGILPTGGEASQIGGVAVVA
jgi:hypothetical protein